MFASARFRTLLANMPAFSIPQKSGKFGVFTYPWLPRLGRRRGVEVLQRARVILYVDGNSDDAFFFGRSLKQVLPEAEWRHVATVHEAKCYLKGKGPYQDRKAYPFPQLVLADSKLPDGTAADLIGWASSQAELGAVQFCVFADPGHNLGSRVDGPCVFDKPGQLREWPQIIHQMIVWLHSDKS